MLRLLRASAGSGKTYRLTYEFIKLLLTIPVEEGASRRRLRDAAELTDPLGHILAITFTNKATNEMKERIVGKLSELADPAVSNPDYLGDLAALTGSPAADVRRAAGIALRQLLNNYSDFQVSTIDSFFQSVLRTFTYETNVSEGYNVELDSEYVAKVGVDTTLTNVNTRVDAETNYWLRRLMTERLGSGRSGWNIFQKSTSSSSLYTEIMAKTKKLESEQYKRHRHEIDGYWKNVPSFREVYEKVEREMTALVAEEHSAMLRALSDVTDAIAASGCGIADILDKRLYPGRFDKIRATAPLDPIPFSYSGEEKKIRESADPWLLKGKRPKNAPEALEAVNGAMKRLFEAVCAYAAKLTAGGIPEWIIYRRTLVYFSLMQKVREASAEYLLENNTIELAETNTLLGKVIGDDEAPFIYERLGTRIDNYLIDEFQDTSRMQWENLVPLLRESESRSGENLIIGDAKQSIYRFRNADPTLISSEVAEEFPVLPGGNTLKDNTNYRSRPGIVRFNNSFFYTLARAVDRLRAGQPMAALRDPDLVTGLYSNIVQPYVMKDSGSADEGYVEIRFPVRPSKRGHASESDDGATADADWYAEFPRLVADLMRRGYKQKEIAVLGATNPQLAKVISEFLNYNRNLPEGETAINFISEESLRVADSEAVKRVLAALRMIARGREIADRRDEVGETRTLRDIDINDIACAFNFLSINAADDFADEDAFALRMEEFVKNPDVASGVDSFLETIHSAALPSLVEAIIARYVNPDEADGQAPYLAAFQDIVLDYCAGNPSDPASFLNWWDRKGNALTINSPQGTDAVNVMTIHKSKGLQFRCVIIPDAGLKILPKSLNEWLWLRPSQASPHFASLPPFIPVETVPELEFTSHAAEYARTFDSAITDKMNVAYVGFTRAVDELYIFAPVSAAEAEKEAAYPDSPGGQALLSQLIAPVCREMAEVCAGAGEDERKYLVDGETPVVDSYPERITFGERLPHARAKAGDEGGDGSPLSATESRAIDRYFIFHDPDKLLFREAEGYHGNDEDPDPRSRGNLLHEMLSLVDTPDSLPDAARRMRIAGRITRTQEREFAAYLAGKLREPAVSGWFADDVEVFNERSILLKGTGVRRPDRVVVTPEGDALVIDYKFGEEHRRHHRQVGAYVGLLRATGSFRSVRGYLWYVGASRVVEVN